MQTQKISSSQHVRDTPEASAWASDPEAEALGAVTDGQLTGKSQIC